MSGGLGAAAIAYRSVCEDCFGQAPGGPVGVNGFLVMLYGSWVSWGVELVDAVGNAQSGLGPGDWAWCSAELLIKDSPVICLNYRGLQNSHRHM